MNLTEYMSMKMIKFNMNNYVWFEPTELGLQVFVDYYKTRGFDHKLEVINGKACLQFHHFIHIYGEYITTYICKDREAFKHYEFYINEERLV